MGIALYLLASYSTPLSLMERRNYSISLCEHEEFVCHQRSVGCNGKKQSVNAPDKHR